MDDPVGDVIAEDIPENEDSAVTAPGANGANGANGPMSEQELACYRTYMNKKLDEYEPIWVS